MIPGMFVLFPYLLGWLIAVFRSREELLLENLALRQQLLALYANRSGCDQDERFFPPSPELSQYDPAYANW
jgi:hypothetical protein